MSAGAFSNCFGTSSHMFQSGPKTGHDFDYSKIMCRKGERTQTLDNNPEHFALNYTLALDL